MFERRCFHDNLQNKYLEKASHKSDKIIRYWLLEAYDARFAEWHLTKTEFVESVALKKENKVCVCAKSWRIEA